MTAYLLAILLGAAPAPASAEDAMRQGVPVRPAATVAISTSALSGPELKLLRNSEAAALRKRQAEESEALRRSLGGRPAAEARRAMNELKASHEKELAALKARHREGARGPAAGKGAAAAGEPGGTGGKPAAAGKKP